MGMLEEQSREERYPVLEVEEDIRILDNREKHWKGIVEENINNKGKVHALRWGVYTKDKEELIKRKFLVEVPHPKGRKIV